VKVCALIAAFNEEATVATVVAGVRRHTPDVVVVDDGSSDRTGERAAAAGAMVVRHAQNRGKGAAIRTGLAHALAGPHTHVLFIDADLQHDPGDVPKLLSAGERAGFDLVIAERLFVKVDAGSALLQQPHWQLILSQFIGEVSTRSRDSG
jgi:glycosyltransferase involved in cell wall biosynthesis